MEPISLENEKRTVKDSIIDILSEEFPLSINQLKSEMVKKYSLKVSYQAIHKEIMILEDRGTIKREGKNIALNIEWITKQRDFFQRAQINYTKLKKYSIGIIKKLQKEGGVLNFEFSSLNEQDDYFVHIMEYFHDITPPDVPIVMHYRHNWWPILYAKREEDILEKDPTNQRFFCICGSDTLLDRWATKYENAIGMNVVISTETVGKWNIHIYGDIIIQFNNDPKISAAVDDFFEKTTNINAYNPKQIMDILQKEAKHNVIIYKNAITANQLREDTIQLCKQKKNKD